MKDIKLKNRRNKLRRSNVVLLSVIVLFLFIGIGFAYIRSSLSINGNSTIAGGLWDVHFANISAILPTNSDNNFSYNMEEHEITFSFRFVDIDESYQFEVDVVNNGKLDAMLSGLEVLGITDEYKDYLNYSITYSDDAIIRENDLLASNTTERIKIMFSFNKEANINKLSTDGNITLTIKLPYIQATDAGQERLHSQGPLLNRLKEVGKNPLTGEIASDASVDFNITPSETNGQGLLYYSKSDVDKPIYYYRGAVDNNNVIFANYCWKIVRTTETGGIKLVYNGVPTGEGKNQCTTTTGTSTQIGMATYYGVDSSPAYVGYMRGVQEVTSGTTSSTKKYEYKKISYDSSYIYGKSVVYDEVAKEYTLQNTRTGYAIGYKYTCLSSSISTCKSVAFQFYNGYYLLLEDGKDIEAAKAEMFSNKYDSNVKKKVDEFYETYIESNTNDKHYEKYLEDAVWCNDRSIVSGGLLSESSAIGYTDFGAIGKRNLRLSSNPNPGLRNAEACTNTNDWFTTKKENGNGVLKYPIGLLTADEVSIAGHSWNGYSTSTYLYTNQNYWTLSPSRFGSDAYWSYAYMFRVLESGELGLHSVDQQNGVRPAISLTKGTIFYAGDGTKENPYIVTP